MVIENKVLLQFSSSNNKGWNMEKLTRDDLIKGFGKEQVEAMEETLKKGGVTLQSLIDKTNTAVKDPVQFLMESHLNLQTSFLKQAISVKSLATVSLIHTILWAAYFVSKIL